MLTVLVFVLALMAPLAGCGGSEQQEEGNTASNDTTHPAEETSGDEETSGEIASSVLVRVSGTPGTTYSGGHGTIEETRSVNDTVLGAEPIDYEEV